MVSLQELKKVAIERKIKTKSIYYMLEKLGLKYSDIIHIDGRRMIEVSVVSKSTDSVDDMSEDEDLPNGW